MSEDDESEVTQTEPGKMSHSSAGKLLAVIEPKRMAQPIQLGRYLLYNEIASGGMATIYLGRMQGAVGFARTVAIKRLHAHFAKDPEFVSMFLDEARLAARIQHPNVIATLDVVATQGELFLVMEHVQGASLSLLAWLGSDPPPTAVATAIIVDALHGLHAAHEARNERGEPLCLIHRDVSPQNILVGVDGAARVLDFGVAKAANRLNATTEQGRIKGKLPYMAPEQVRAGKLTRLVDVYAAAVVYWEALTGRPLFGADNQGEIIERVLFADVEPPSRYAPDVPPEIDAIVLKGLSRDPAARFSSAREMALAIERALRPALRTEVAAWVERVAQKALRSRAQEVAHIESFANDPSVEDLMAELDSGQVDAPIARGAALPIERDTVPNAQAPGHEALGTTTTMSKALAETEVSDVSAPRRRRFLSLGVGVAAVSFTALGLWLGFRTLRTPASRADAIILPTTSAPSSLQDKETAAPPSAEPTTEAKPRVESSAATPIANSLPSAAPTAVKKPSIARPAATTIDCTVPYTIGADGKHIYKRGCLR